MDVAATATPVSIQLDDYFAFSSDACVQVIPLIGQVFVFVFCVSSNLCCSDKSKKGPIKVVFILRPRSSAIQMQR